MRTRTTHYTQTRSYFIIKVVYVVPLSSNLPLMDLYLSSQHSIWTRMTWKLIHSAKMHSKRGPDRHEARNKSRRLIQMIHSSAQIDYLKKYHLLKMARVWPRVGFLCGSGPSDQSIPGPHFGGGCTAECSVSRPQSKYI
jgi:hypothetical protein